MMALQAGFAGDIRGGSAESSLEWLAEENPLHPKNAASVMAFSQTLLRGVQERHSDLDELIHRYAPAWPVNLLSPVDRNILRIALFELLYYSDTPDKTAVNEAVELAKAFGSESSARFVNGVLGSVMADLSNSELNRINPCLKGDDLLATVNERVKSIVVDKLGVEESDVEESSSFVDNLNADSLDLVELIMAFEEEFSTDDNQVEISDDDASNIRTVGDAISYLKEHGVADE